MKKLIVILVLGVLVPGLYGQVADDFTDGDFTQDPVWTGDTNEFEVNSSGMLHLAATGADTSILVTANSMINETEWTFWIKLSFNTSVNNFARVYLVSDHADLKTSCNGYYLQIGGAKDSIQFVRQNGTQTTVLLQGMHACTNHSTNILRLKMTHDSTGTWTMYSDGTGGTNYLKEGCCLDNGLTTTSWFGIYCHYTSSNATKYYFDEFYVGAIKIDTLPPVGDSLKVVDSTHLAILFNENIDGTEARNISHYLTNTHGRPSLATTDPTNGKKVLLEFEPGFTSGSYDTLTLSGITDLAGNRMAETSIPFSFYVEKAFNVVINEIMADPEPVTGLPESEYVELYNRTGFPVSLKGWTFEYSSYSKTFPDATISAFGYLILTKGSQMNSYGPCVDLFTSFSTLSNEGTTLVLKNSKGNVIHAVSYSADWYLDPLKDNGGWSLEMIDPDNPCGCVTNWKASVDVKGGTPGKINSIRRSNPDHITPYLKRARIISDSAVEILFSESMDSLSLVGQCQWKADKGNCAINSVSVIPPGFGSIRIQLKEPIVKQHLYTVSCQGLARDCAGNFMDTAKSVKFGIPDSIISRDVVINEILPHPVTGGEKFIELYNRSSKILDLAQLVLGTFDTITNQAADLKTISEEGFLVFPGDYILLTQDAADICKRYNCADTISTVTMNAMPSYNSEEDNIVLAMKNDGTLVDRVYYSQRMYSELLTSAAGISLERINPNLSSLDMANWHPAAESYGFATPGYRNSQYFMLENNSDQVTVSPGLFTPDDDGQDDNVLIRFNLETTGYFVNIAVFDANGFHIRNLASNRNISPEDGILWDGCDDNYRKAPLGIYIFNIQLFQPEGRSKHYRKTVVLGGKR